MGIKGFDYSTRSGPTTEAAFEALPNADPATRLPVQFLFRLTGYPTATPAKIEGGLKGDRILFYVEKGSFEGPAVRGNVHNPSGDWAHVTKDGGLFLDVRLTLKTDDDEIILMTYQGSITGKRVHVCGHFDAGKGPYQWLNDTVYFGVGRWNEDGSLTYLFYAPA